MVASTEPKAWAHLDNGVVDCKFSTTPTSPTPPPPDMLLERGLMMTCSGSAVEERPVTETPTTNANGIMKSLAPDGGGGGGGAIFAVPAVPRKTLSPRRTHHHPSPSFSAATSGVHSRAPRKSYGKKSRSIRGPSLLSSSTPFTSTTSPVGSPSMADGVSEEASVTDIPPPLKISSSSSSPAKVRWSAEHEEVVSHMVYAIAGLLHRRNVDRLTGLTQRFSRINNYHIQHAVENALTGGTSMFHDFLNRESFRPEAKGLGMGMATTEDASRKSAKEEALVISCKASEDKSMQDLFGVLGTTTSGTAATTTSKDDMKSKTPSQLMEFVKRVESNQRREAFEKQQRPAYLLKLTRTQSADRSSSYIAHAQNLHRAIDRATVLDPGRTDSSSGGESADETENDVFYQQNVQPDNFIPLERRALHRYAKVRHAISTRYQYGHRQFARLEYGSQVIGSLLQRLQQKQGIAVFGDGALEDCKTSIRAAFPLHRDAACPRSWDDRDVVTVAKTANSSTFLRMPTPASNSIQTLHPSAANLLFKKKMKVVTPNFGINYQLDTYEATMWKERLCSGKIAVEGASEGEDWEEVVEKESREEDKADAECVVSSARGCARARPLSAFRKRMIVTMDSYPPKRMAQEEKPRYCDCYSRMLMPDVVGPVSCALCMGRLPAPNWSTRTALMKTTPADALSHLDQTYHPHLSQPSNRSLDAALSGVSMDFEPSKQFNVPVKPRLTSRQKYLLAVRREGELLNAIRKQEEEIRVEKMRMNKLAGKHCDEVSVKRVKMRREDATAKSGRPRGRRPQIRQSSVRKRRHSSVSSDTTVSSTATSRTRSVSVGSVDNGLGKAALRRGLSRTTSISKGSHNRKKRDGPDPSSFVIPYGMAAPSKIEKIQYKEIVVPKFRDLKSTHSQRTTNTPWKMENVNGGGALSDVPDCPSPTVKVEPLDDPDFSSLSDEDLSDAAFILRHVPCEAEERSRFNVPEKNPRRKNVPSKTAGGGDSPAILDGQLTNPTPFSTTLTVKQEAPERHPSTPGRKPGRNYQPKGRRDSRGRMMKIDRTGTTAAPATISPAASRAPAPPPAQPQPTSGPEKARIKRPRKTAAEISAMFPLNTRPVRVRRSTFRASPDAIDP